ncbi:MAG TPA: 16S rRNA (guanine(966)-N(2))-methyltransferase RsmD, partial [Steroidobacteraceae bacterium]|nr:16S rRNA (guanine(966)-N(2))-methyltransferase RsmD [Steroidobacteraceae bacterium]
MTPSARKSGNAAASNGANRLRIIGGRWRGSKLNFPNIDAIRPTPDRVRETLFNWLQTDISNARCLDLYAGSGALGLEALSRGASAVTFVDREPAIGKYLRDTLQRLDGNGGNVITMDSSHYLTQTPTLFDVVFLDPPFAAATKQQLLSNLFAQLENGWLAPHAWIYIECPSDMGS